MKRVRVTVHPREADLPKTFEAVTGADDQFASVQVLNWNVTTTPAAFLLRVTGDVDRFAALLARDDAVADHELLPASATESYCYVTGAGTPDAWALWDQFNRATVMTVPPATWNTDGSYTFTMVGQAAAIQAAVDDVPSPVRVEIDAVGGATVAPERIVDRLSDRQREAVRTAVDLGYYDVPRTATAEDVAAELGCATSTAAEHLRKVESTVLTGLFDAPTA